MEFEQIEFIGQQFLSSHQQSGGGMGSFQNVLQSLLELRKCTGIDQVQQLRRQLDQDLRTSEDDDMRESPLKKKQKKLVEGSSRNPEWNRHVVGEYNRLEVGRLKKRVKKLIGDVRELIRQGNFTDGITIAEPMKGYVLEAPNLAGETTARVMMEEIWNCLMDKDMTKVGVHGMGGIGKTTVIKHIHNRFLDGNSFDKVIWVTVSKEPNINKLQDTIALMLGIDLSGSEDSTIRAAMLSAALKGVGRYVLILDDMWEAFGLNDIGIPEPTLENGCKLVLTTRVLEVCVRMNFKPIQMVYLSEEEALNLFLDHVGSDVVRVGKLKKVVEYVVKECDCLPLAIITVAEGMRGEMKAYVWNNALKKLREHSKNPDDKGHKVIEHLKFSYERLKNKKLQDCLIYCALYPEDCQIEREELIPRLIEEGIIEEMEIRQEELDEGNVLLDTLLNSCLLESVSYGPGTEYVKMHDFVRDMALQITNVSPRFMVKSGLRLKELPEKWSEDLEKVSLMENQISEFSSNTLPLCPKVSTLLLNGNPFESIPRSFLHNFCGLKILNLSRTQIKVLPDSISDLVNLVALLLSGCTQLKQVPSLKKLTRLRSLDLANTLIDAVPQGIEELVNIRHLNLDKYDELLMFPDDILPKLSKLQHLVIGGKVKAHELLKLEMLETFEGMLDVEDFIVYMKHRDFEGRPTHYHIEVGLAEEERKCFLSSKAIGVFDQELFFIRVKNCKISKSSSGENPLVFPEDVQILHMTGCNDAMSLCDVVSFGTMTNLRSCKVTRCKGMTYLVSTCSSSFVPQNLEYLQIGGMNSLRALFRRECIVPSLLPLTIFSCLKEFTCQGCPEIQELFPLEIMSNFKSLEMIEVVNCDKLTETVTSFSDNSEDMDQEEKGNLETKKLTLPKLKYLLLEKLVELETICPTSRVFVCDSLVEITVRGCPKLKRIPLFVPLDGQGQPSPPPCLRSIETTRKDWESLEWDHPNTKTVLERFCRFVEFL